jgi:CHAD domain-containing protein
MPAICATTPLWIAARQLLEAHGKEFFKRWDKVVRSFEVEDIHDLRVASRRLREALALFEPCFAGKSLSRLGKKVKQVTGVLGDLRNTDESQLFFSQLEPRERAAAEPELQALLDRLGLEREAARKQLQKDLNALRPGPLHSSLNGALAAPLLFGNSRTDPFQGLSLFADAALATRARPIAELLPQALDEANAAAQHQLRIAVKRMRYRLEILEPLFGAGFAELQRSLKGYQELLGKLHDLDVFSGMVLERVPEGACQQHLLHALTVRRSRCYLSFVKMIDGSPVDTIAAKARSYL